MSDSSTPDSGSTKDMPEQPAAMPPETSEAPAAAPPEAPQPPTGGYAPPMPPGQPAPPAPRVKLKTSIPMFLLGLATSAAVFFLAIWLANSVAAIANVVGIAWPLLMLALFFVFLGLLLTARKNGNAPLRSFAMGAMWAYAAIPLFLLVAFGSCLIGLNG